MKQVLEQVFRAGLAAVAPDAALLRHVRREGDCLLAGGRVWPLPRAGRVLAVGAGKGVAPLALALENVLEDRLDGGWSLPNTGTACPCGAYVCWRRGTPYRMPLARLPRRICWRSWNRSARTIWSSVCSPAAPVP